MEYVVFQTQFMGFQWVSCKTNQGGVRWVPRKFHGKAVKRRGIFPMKLGTKELLRVFPLILWMVAKACTTKRMVETYKQWDVYQQSTGAGFRNHPQ